MMTSPLPCEDALLPSADEMSAPLSISCLVFSETYWNMVMTFFIPSTCLMAAMPFFASSLVQDSHKVDNLVLGDDLEAAGADPAREEKPCLDLAREVGVIALLGEGERLAHLDLVVDLAYPCDVGYQLREFALVVSIGCLPVDQEVPVDAGCTEAALTELGVAVLVEAVDCLRLNGAVIYDSSDSPAVSCH